MDESDSERWMLERARSMMDRNRRLKRKFNELGETRSGKAEYQPSVDIFETDTEFWVFAALPGVQPDGLEVLLVNEILELRARRPLPELFRAAKVHRLEIPYGRFERRLALPPGHYRLGQVQMAHGCAIVQVAKLHPAR